jgi:hypothetical protein
MRPWVALFLIACMAGGWHWWTTERPVHRAPGVIAPDEPAQINLDPAEPFAAKGYTFIKRARFDMTVRLLRKERYRTDAESGLAPFDLGVGWGEASDSAILDQLSFSQMGRFFYWQPKRDSFPLSPAALNRHVAQLHAIPATDDVASQLEHLRPGQLITAHGYLVDVRGPHGFVWNTSMTREDTGDGACEIFWVEALQTD